MRKTRNLVLLLVLILSVTGCMSPFVRAAYDGDTKTATELLDKGADVNEEFSDGWTPLMWATRGGKTDMVKLLLERGADVNAHAGRTGHTALFLAVTGGYTDIIQVLLAKGADINIKAAYGDGNVITWYSSMEFAQKMGNTQIVQMLKSAQTKNANKFNSANMLLIAVMDFDGKGVSRADASRVSEWLRTELINTNQFRVIERSAMNAILKEQAFAQTGCTDTSCAVQVGKLLSARKMLVGNVESWSGKVFINGRIIDVEKGVAEFAHKETVNSMLDLDTGAANFAKNLAKRINGM
jgi:TolB-like protein